MGVCILFIAVVNREKNGHRDVMPQLQSLEIQQKKKTAHQYTEPSVFILFFHPPATQQ